MKTYTTLETVVVRTEKLFYKLKRRDSDLYLKLKTILYRIKTQVPSSLHEIV